MAKALKIVGTVVAVAGLALVTGGAALGLGLSLGISIAGTGITAGALLAAGTLISAAGSLLGPKAKAPEISSANADRLTVSINVRTPRVSVIGSTAMATDLRDQEWSADQSLCHRFIVVAAHKVHAIREIWFDDVLAWTSSGGVQAKYSGYLIVTPVLEGSAANAINIGARMGSARRYTGCAYVYLRYKVTGNSKKAESPFSSAIPSRVTIVGDGADVYDPRLDSTVPSGSGSHRASDQSTWAWTDSQARNPALAMLWFLLGWRIAGKLSVGKGIPAARIDLASFITAANICDEPVIKLGGGTEPRYRCDGVWNEGDDPGLVLDNLKATMNAVLDDVDGRIRLTVLHNDLAAPAGDLTTDDVLGEFTWEQTPPLDESINVIRGGYTDPSTASLYQLVDYPEVRIDSPDGIDRSQTVNLPLVQSAGQAQRLVKLRLGRAQFGATFTAVFNAGAWKFEKGDVVRFTFAPLGWSQKLFRIADMAIQVDGTVPLMLREEHPDIYAAYADARAAVAGAAPTSYDTLLLPVTQAIGEAYDRVVALGSDSVLSAGSEKQRAIIDRQALRDDYDAIEDRFVALGSPADISAGRNAAIATLDALETYLGGLVPAWDAIGSDTPIVSSTWQAVWTAAYNGVAIYRAAVTGRKGDDGAGAFTLANVANTVFPAPDAVRKIAGGDAWNAKARTVQGYDAASISAKVPRNAFIGLATDTSADAGYGTIRYGFANSGDGNCYVYRPGAFFLLGASAEIEQPQIVHDGATVRYLTAGIERYSHAADAAAETLFGVAAIYAVGAEVTDIAFSKAGRRGADALTVYLTNETHTVPADVAGNVTSYVGATFTVKIEAAGADVAAAFSVSVAPGGNPQGLDLTGSVHPNYQVVGGFDAGEETASITLRFTGSGAFAGTVIDKVFSLAKSKAPAAGVTPPLIALDADNRVARIGADGNYVGGQTTNFAATRNSAASGATVWQIITSAGAVAYSGSAADFAAAAPTYWSTSGGDQLTMTPAGLSANMDAYGGSVGRFAIRAVSTGVSDTVSLNKVKDGLNGAPGSPGAPGADGFAVDTETTNFVQPVFSSGASKPAWTGGSGTIRLNKGGARVTAGVTYAVLGNTGVAGLALAGDTFSFAGATGDAGSFTIRATLGGVNYDKIVAVKKVYDGEAAFRGSVVINAVGTTSAATPVPGGRAVTISAQASYTVSTVGEGAFRGRMALYWRNVTDAGPWNLLGSEIGSYATRTNTGTVEEPVYANTPGAVSAAFSFTAPATDKQIGYEARLTSDPAGGSAVTVAGTMKLEVSS